MRRILVDRADLDQLIERFREVAPLDVRAAHDHAPAGSFESMAVRRTPGRRARPIAATGRTSVGTTPDSALANRDRTRCQP